MKYLQTNAKIIGTIKPKTEDKTSVIQETIVIADRLSKKAEEIKMDKLKKMEISNKCLICQEPVYENAIECPSCNQIFHFKHLISWVKENERCPYCKTKLSILSHTK